MKITKTLVTIACMAMLSVTCKGQEEEEEKKHSSHNGGQHIFPKGQKGPAKFFTGNAYPYGLVDNDSIYTTLAGNVYFEPGARSNWHSHPAGQILIVVEGEGYHQIEGQPRETLKVGDVVKCPPETKHWHGASIDTGMSHIYIIPNTEKGIVNWMEPVTDEQYKNP